MPSQGFRLDPPRFIDTQEQLVQALADFRRSPYLAVDTEANSLFAYQEQVCLIQITTDKEDYILDALALDDLSDLGEILIDPDIEKIFHASEYDILIMHEDLGFEFRNLFDTMLAAQILGRQQLGLRALLEEYFNVQVDKKYQKADWGKRPLSNEMLKYAQVDTHYLFQIRQILADELNAKGLMPIADEDFQRACLVHRQPKDEKLDPCWRIQGARNLTPQQAAVLEKLCQYREQTAKRIDRPVFKVLSSQVLLKLAEQAPTSVPQLLKLDLASNRAVKRHAQGLVQAIQDGLKSPPVHPPRKNRVDDAFLSREHALLDWRKRIARKLDVNSAVILPRELLYKLVKADPRTKAEVDQVLADVPWRRKQYGEEILAALDRASKGKRS